jgi:hypothetical protein
MSKENTERFVVDLFRKFIVSKGLESRWNRAQLRQLNEWHAEFVRLRYEELESPEVDLPEDTVPF